MPGDIEINSCAPAPTELRSGYEDRARRNNAPPGRFRPPRSSHSAQPSVVARRLAENTDVSVLLLEAGGHDDVPAVMRAEQCPFDLGSERDWNFAAQPTPRSLYDLLGSTAANPVWRVSSSMH
jgi:hypothetical protein